ncbi:hypothetical protein [Hymenobacter sp. BRD128]|nr:hypothetical protein [Hymenobacter sp. BRD128]
MHEPSTQGGPHEHIYTTDARPWDKAKAHARENRKAPTAAENAL